MSTTAIQDEIKAYEKEQAHLEAELFGKWVLFHNGELVDSFEDFQDVADAAVRQFGRGPYLIRQVGAPPPYMPLVGAFANQDATD